MATRIAEAAPAEGKSTWSIDSARALYNIEGWGAGFFDINSEGHVIVRPDKDRPDHVVDLFAITNDLEEQGIALPVLLRFSDILRSRIEALTVRFEQGARRVWPTRRIHHGVSDQGEPAAPRHRGDRRIRQAARRRAWSAGASPSFRRFSDSRRTRNTSLSAMATRTRSSCASPSWARSSDTASSS
jgi:hypothetical protein